MTQLTNFKTNSENFESKKAIITNCCAQKMHDKNAVCANCPDVFYCDKIKEFGSVWFEMALSKLKECQQSNALKSCMSRELFFECQTRKDYVNATYEKMNEGRSGEFDF